jgi:hypothetical protein
MTSDGKEFPIMKFENIVDTEIGLLKLINDKYHDKDTFYWSIMEAPVKVQIWLLYIRKRKNPLTILAKDVNNKELLNSYYQEFMEKEYVYILRNSIVTNLYNAVKKFVTVKGITPIIVCNNEMEANYLRKLDNETFSKCNIVINKRYADEITESNDIIYLKSVDEVIPILAKQQYKHIYLAGYRYNFQDDEKTMILKDYATLIAGLEDLKVYEPYSEKDMIKGA